MANKKIDYREDFKQTTSDDTIKLNLQVARKFKPWLLEQELPTDLKEEIKLWNVNTDNYFGKSIFFKDEFMSGLISCICCKRRGGKVHSNL